MTVCDPEAMNAWRSYWAWYGVRRGLFQGFMVTAWVASGIGLVGGLLWLAWSTR